MVKGPTGSGKSTLCDIIPWIMFGRTSKGGTVDEVLSWPGNEVTYGCLELDNGINIYRIRGPTAKDNDLYYSAAPMTIFRGKDLNDTQKLINNLLGFDYELYLSGAYFHEFSTTAQFFITATKIRRQIIEQIVDLSLAKKLQIAVSDKNKHLDKELNNISNEVNKLQYNADQLNRLQIVENNKAKKWELDNKAKKSNLEASYDNFEKNRKKIISKKCNSCGTVLLQPKEVIDDSSNPYLNSIAELENTSNPHSGTVKDFTKEINENKHLSSSLKVKEDSLKIEHCDLELLSDVIQNFRGALVKNTVVDLETSTNKILTDHFDSEIRVEFNIETADKLDVTIWKDGNQCSYSQLSKGQRQLLKLSFGVSVMKCVQNHHGLKFNSIFLDEALDGLDEILKVKSYGLLQKLEQEYESVFVVEHSTELKSMFARQFEVSLEDGHSVITQS